MRCLTSRIILALALAGCVTVSAALEVRIPELTSSIRRTVAIPVSAYAADEMGRFELILHYDPDVLDVRGIDAGEGLDAGMTTHSSKRPGHLWIAGVIETPAAEYLPMLRIRAQVQGATGTETALQLVSARAWRSGGGSEIAVTPADGHLEVVRALIPFRLTPLEAGGVVLLLGMVSAIVVWIRQPHELKPAWEVTPPPVAPPPAAAPPPAEIDAPPIAAPPIAIDDDDPPG